MRRFTPALALKNLVHSIRRLNKPKARLFDAVSHIFPSNNKGIKGIDSYFLVARLFEKTENLIEKLNIDDDSKTKMNSDLTKIKSCFEIPMVAETIEAIVKNHLTVSSEDALEYMHIAIVQNQYFEFDPKESDDLAKEFKDVLKLVEKSNLPYEIAEPISLRLKQVILVCEHFSLWGPEGLDAAIAELAGEMVVQNIKFGDKDHSGVFSRLASKIPCALEFANKASKGLDTLDNLLEKSKSVFEAITSSGGS